MGKSSGPEAAVVVVSLRNFFFFFFFRSFHHLVRACKPFYFTSFSGSSFHPIFIRLFLLLPFGKQALPFK